MNHRFENQFNAQMRAALGLPAIDTNEALYFQAQQAAAQRQQTEQLTLQRDFHLRQALLQDQIDRHFSLERLRGLPSGFLEDNRELVTELDLRDLEEQRQQLEEQRLNDQIRQQVAAAQLYQDEVRRQQLNFRQEELAQHAHAIAQAQAQAQAAQVQKAVQEQRAQAAQAAQDRVHAQLAAQELANAKVKAQEFAKTKQKKAKTTGKGQASAQATGKQASRTPGALIAPAIQANSKPAAKTSKVASKAKSPSQKAVKTKKKVETKKRSATAHAASVERPTKRPATAKTKAALKAAAKARKVPAKSKAAAARRGGNKSALDAVAIAAGMKKSVGGQPKSKGTLEGLLNAAVEDEKLDDAAVVLSAFKTEVEWSDSDDDDEDNDPDGFCRPTVPQVPAELIDVGRFKSLLPALPEEPEIELIAPVYTEKSEESIGPSLLRDDRFSPRTKADTKAGRNGKPADLKSKKVSTILDYPCPIDTWWPSVTSVRSERRACGETSDEDNFDDPPLRSEEPPLFRANETKIRQRLSREVEPGVLEKLNHCRIHRTRTKHKKNTNTPELVYCCQVTELYPNDIIVACSICGTWRHAACGGHHKPYSTRENCKEPFVAVCENCHEEQPYLEEFPKGAQRLERQRMEQLRRGMATSAVMRFASYSKHNGTYKWPLGSVSGTHISGHTRSVQARHDKAERQWTEMSNRLNRFDNGRPKDRVRVRTKELERLLVSIEDAESYTDRHNMMMFLLRDTARAVPVGYENQPKNLLDPDEEDVLPAHMSTKLDESEDGDMEGQNCQRSVVGEIKNAIGEVDEPSSSPSVDPDEILAVPSGGPGSPSEPGHSVSGTTHQAARCIRVGCTKRRRFDSAFCSDGCGVHVLELDLLRSLQDAGEIHPSVLRLT